jgi:hypothetical protein
MQELSKSSDISFAYRRSLISAYKEAMRDQFKSAVLAKSFPPNQYRDTIRTFLTGWFRCLYYNNDVLGISLFAQEFGRVFNAEWYPSSEWEFWG